jgi:CheY-like chemotaxis protein
VEIDSEPDHGTGITLYLPRAESGPDEISEHDAKSDERPMESTRILVVDDDPDVRNLAVSQLRGLGYQVEDAVNANNALVKLSDDGSFDLLLTDVVMPGGMSGLELWRHAEPLQPGLKVIFTSGYSDDVISATESLASNFPFVRKPYVRDDLARVVSKTLLRGPN